MNANELSRTNDKNRGLRLIKILEKLYPKCKPTRRALALSFVRDTKGEWHEKTVCNWMSGGNLDNRALARLSEMGGDALYILTGQHTPAPVKDRSKPTTAELVERFKMLYPHSDFAELAQHPVFDLASFSRDRIRRYFSGEWDIPEEFVGAVQRDTGCDGIWLLTGEGEPFPGQRPLSRPAAEVANLDDLPAQEGMHTSKLYDKEKGQASPEMAADLGTRDAALAETEDRLKAILAKPDPAMQGVCGTQLKVLAAIARIQCDLAALQEACLHHPERCAPHEEALERIEEILPRERRRA